MSEKEKKLCDTCEYPERNNYYYGKSLNVRDFKVEQKYFNDKRWLLNRMVTGWGVVCGLDVKKNEDGTKVVVTPGLAIDCCGREIILCREVKKELKPTEEECRSNQNITTDKELYIGIRFLECKTEKVRILDNRCEINDKYEFNRIKECSEVCVLLPSDVDLNYPPGLCPLNYKEHLFTWENISQDEQEKDRLKKYLNEDLSIDWAENAKIVMNGDIIHVEDKDKKTSLDISIEGNLVRIQLNNENIRVCNYSNCLIKKDKEDKRYIYLVKNQAPSFVCCETKKKKGYPECPEKPCNYAVILAKVTLNETNTIETIDCCSYRKQVYDNKSLFDLINCYTGDLPHIVGINWIHDEDMEWEYFEKIIDSNKDYSGLEVIFDKEVEGIDERTFLFVAKYFDENTRFFNDLYIPGVVEYKDKKAVFKVDEGWYGDMMAGSFIHRGAGFKVILKGDYIFDINTKRALDANFIAGKLPSGNGTQGGDFISWFKVGENPNPPKRPEVKRKKEA